MSTHSETVITVTGLHKAFANRPVLQGIDFEVKRGETVVVLGGSGTGKSVLLKHLIGLIKPDLGHALVLGQRVDSMAEADLVPLRLKVSYIFQNGALFDSLTVGENIALPLVEHGLGEQNNIGARVTELLRQVELDGIANMMPSDLSGGMRKRVALARGLALTPEIILYDEPTAGLDPLSALTITKLIGEIKRSTGATSLLVTHDLGVAKLLADRVMFMKGGRIAFSGAFQEAVADGGDVGQFFRVGSEYA